MNVKPKEKVIDLLIVNGFNWDNPVGTISISLYTKGIIEVCEFEWYLKYRLLFLIDENGNILSVGENIISDSILFLMNEFKAKTYRKLTRDEEIFILVNAIN